MRSRNDGKAAIQWLSVKEGTRFTSNGHFGRSVGVLSLSDSFTDFTLELETLHRLGEGVL